jgi:hypothetical protein
MKCEFCEKKEATVEHETEAMVVIRSCIDEECMRKANRKANKWRR